MHFSPNPRSFTLGILMLLSGYSASLWAELDANLLQGLAARTLGPAAVSGRITSIDAVAENPNHIVIGAANGGVWISENGGLTWTPVFR